MVVDNLSADRRRNMSSASGTPRETGGDNAFEVASTLFRSFDWGESVESSKFLKNLLPLLLFLREHDRGGVTKRYTLPQLLRSAREWLAASEYKLSVTLDASLDQAYEHLRSVVQVRHDRRPGSLLVLHRYQRDAAGDKRPKPVANGSTVVPCFADVRAESHPHIRSNRFAVPPSRPPFPPLRHVYPVPLHHHGKKFDVGSEVEEETATYIIRVFGKDTFALLDMLPPGWGMGRDKDGGLLFRTFSTRADVSVRTRSCRTRPKGAPVLGPTKLTPGVFLGLG